MSVNIYQDIITSTVTSKSIVRLAKSNGIKHKDEHAVLKMYLSHLDNNGHLNPSIAYNLFRIADEYTWMKNGKKTLFPNDDLLSAAWKSKFDLGKVEGGINFIRTPFKSFVLAMPSHIKFDGEELPSPLISFQRYNELGKGMDIQSFANAFNLKTPIGVNPNDKFYGEQILYIQYQSKENRDLYQCLQVPQSTIPYVLESSTVEEYLQRINENASHENVTSSIDLTSEQAGIQFKLMKLVVSLMVFYCVSPDSITKGLERYKSKGVPRYKGSAVSYEKHVLGAEYVSTGRKNAMHLRRLTHERYYRSDEFKDTERGTRWIVCGTDNTTYTQEHISKEK